MGTKRVWYQNLSKRAYCKKPPGASSVETHEINSVHNVCGIHVEPRECSRSVLGHRGEVATIRAHCLRRQRQQIEAHPHSHPHTHLYKVTSDHAEFCLDESFEAEVGHLRVDRDDKEVATAAHALLPAPRAALRAIRSERRTPEGLDAVRFETKTP